MAEPTPLGRLALAPLPPSRIVAWRGATALTHADLRAGIQAWAASLQEYPSPHCALYMRDGFEFACALLGAWHAGKTVWLPGDVQPATLGALREHVTCFIGEFPGSSTLRAPNSGATFALHEPPPDHPALQVFTSGSTGQPTAIPKTLRQLDAEVRGMQTLWGAAVRDATVIATVPHQHFYGLLFKLLWPLGRGAAFGAASLDYPEEVCAAVAHRPSIWIASPALLSRLPEGLTWPKENLRAVFSAGSPLPADAASQCAALLGCWPEEVYGSSETGATGRRTQQHAPAYWECLPGVRVRRNADNGQLEIHSPWLPYNACLVADRGEVFDDGCFNLLGRTDRIVKIAEKRISLDALEQVLCALPEVAEARLVTLPEGRLAAVIALTPAGDADLETCGRRAMSERLRSALSAHVERVALPRRWRFVAELPRNQLGKITSTALLDLFSDSDSRPRNPIINQETREADEIKMNLLVPDDLLYFDGHFPGAPILPGVVQVDWAVGFCRRLLGMRGPFQRLEQIKFQQTIRPGMEVELMLRALPAKSPNQSSIEFRYASTAGAHSSGRIVFGA